MLRFVVVKNQKLSALHMSYSSKFLTCTSKFQNYYVTHKQHFAYSVDMLLDATVVILSKVDVAIMVCNPHRFHILHLSKFCFDFQELAIFH